MNKGLASPCRRYRPLTIQVSLTALDTANCACGCSGPSESIMEWESQGTVGWDLSTTILWSMSVCPLCQPAKPKFPKTDPIS